MLGESKLIIVDEPNAGLDPTERKRFHNILAKVAEDKIVLFSTHIALGVIELFTQLAIIHKGRAVYQDHPNDVMNVL